MVYSRESDIHGNGLFAQVPISTGTRIIQYVGERITKTESLRRCEQDNRYIFSLDDAFDIDGSIAANLARFANHSCSPNAETDIIEGEIWIVALRDIRPGEEITYNYGYDLEEYRDFPCHCGTPICVGFIVAEEYFDHVRTQNEHRRYIAMDDGATPEMRKS